MYLNDFVMTLFVKVVNELQTSLLERGLDTLWCERDKVDV